MNKDTKHVIFINICLTGILTNEQYTDDYCLSKLTL